MLARIIGAVMATLFATQTFAWDNFGHMQVAQVAWDGLAPAVRIRVGQLMRLNPQYVAWTVNIAPEKGEQIAFVRAATWPDFIKSAAGYVSDGTEGGNRPPPGPEAGQNIGFADKNMHKYWHFIDIPFPPDKTPLDELGSHPLGVAMCSSFVPKWILATFAIVASRPFIDDLTARFIGEEPLAAAL
ncbi:hypothetical protein IVB02_04330 [Bradyrhizobium sp. 166]|uniref:hypothetical protein n=1 Tax=Bradyrhizobium sp. 166 TaxID=2782638 RepID=UPI001FF94E81|nr:hypothetical protein [Bradyrhizobium sp. 166]MCK1600671.1 hypothetical protein [Bradyrhizobium sp. 166]